MFKRKRIKTTVRLDKVSTDGTKKHYKSVTLPCQPKDAWRVIVDGCSDVLNIDLEEIRAQRKRKGGK